MFYTSHRLTIYRFSIYLIVTTFSLSGKKFHRNSVFDEGSLNEVSASDGGFFLKI